MMVFSGNSSVAQVAHPYRTSPSIALTSSLEAKWQATRGRIPLRDMIGQWRLAYSIPVWLDRRIASDYDVATSDQCVTVGDSIAEVARQIHADIALVDGVVMLVPEGLGAHVESIYWSLATDAINSVWLRNEDLVLSWEDGANSRDILRSFVARYPLMDLHLDQIEHDVWPAALWGKTTPLMVAIGLLGSFDLKPVVAGESLAADRIDLQTPTSPVEWVYRDEISKLGKDRWRQWPLFLQVHRFQGSGLFLAFMGLSERQFRE